MAEKEEITSLGYAEGMALFEKPVIDAGAEKIRYIQTRPINQLSSGSGIEFVISGTGKSYIDLRRTTLHIKAKILLADGSDIPRPPLPREDPADNAELGKVAPINLWFHSLFSQVDVYLQQKLITSSSSSYFLKAYMDTILSMCPLAREGQLDSQLFFKDSPTNMDNSDPVSGLNRGLWTREKYTRSSNLVDMEGVPLVDVFQLDKYILNGTSIVIKFYQTPPSLNLMAATPGSAYKTVIEEAYLNVCKITPTPQMLTAHQETLNKNFLAIYSYKKADIKRYTLPTGSYDFTQDDIFQSMIPTSLVIGFVSNAALSGSYEKKTFNFQHYFVNSVEVSVDGESVPSRAIKTKFGEDYFDSNYINAYMSLSRGAKRTSEDHCISRQDYPGGFSLFKFNLEADINGEETDDSDFWPSIKTGNLRVEIHFDKPLPEPVSVIIYGTFPRIFKIDKTRDVILDL